MKPYLFGNGFVALIPMACSRETTVYLSKFIRNICSASLKSVNPSFDKLERKKIRNFLSSLYHQNLRGLDLKIIKSALLSFNHHKSSNAEPIYKK